MVVYKLQALKSVEENEVETDIDVCVEWTYVNWAGLVDHEIDIRMETIKKWTK